MNAIGTQLRDPINSGLTRRRMAVSYGRRPGTREESRRVSTRFSLSMEMSRLTRDGIGTQLRDPINSGLTRRRMAVSYGRRPGTREESRRVSTRFSLSMEMSRLTRDGTAEPVSRDQILRHARGQGNVHFPCSADHEQDWQPYPVDPYSAIYVMTIHTYIYISYSCCHNCKI